MDYKFNMEILFLRVCRFFCCSAAKKTEAVETIILPTKMCVDRATQTIPAGDYIFVEKNRRD